MRKLLLAAAIAAAVSAGAAAPSGAVPAHRHGCHKVHKCPSDHHNYRWRKLLCTSYAKERQKRDTIRIRHGGRIYWCHR